MLTCLEGSCRSSSMPSRAGVISLEPRSSQPTGVHFLLGVTAPTLLASKLESRKIMVTYNPQCIMRQFGYIWSPSLAMWATAGTACSEASIFLPNLARDGVRSPGVALHWRRCTKAFSDFVSPNSKGTQVMPVMVYTRDLHLRVKKDYIDPATTLEQAQHQLVPGRRLRRRRTNYQYPASAYTG